MTFYQLDFPGRIVREEVEPGPDLDPDLALWPSAPVSRWPFSGAPAVGTWPLGWLAVDNTATVYICVQGGSPGVWQAIGGSGAVFQTLQLNNPGVDNAVQINEILASGQPVMTNQIGVCYISSPIITPPGLGVWSPFVPAKQGGPFAVPGLRIMAAPGFSDVIPTAAQQAYGLPSTLDALVICAGISSWLSGVVVDGSTSPTNTTPLHQYPVALYNTDISVVNGLFRQSAQVGGAGAACCDIGDIGNSGGTVPLISLSATNPIVAVSVQTGSDSNQYLVLTFAGPLPPHMFGVTMGGATNIGTAQNWQMTLTGVTVSGGTGSLPANPFLIGAAGSTSALPALTTSQFSVKIANTITGVTGSSPTAAVSFVGAARFGSLNTDYESGTGIALQVSGTDTKIIGGRRLQGLFASSAAGLDVTGVHFTGQGGSMTYFGNTGTWNTVIAARGQMGRCIFDTIPTGSNGLIGYMASDTNHNPFSLVGCELHENTNLATGFPVINRINSGAGTHGNNPLNLSGLICYGAGPTNPAVFTALIDNPVTGDMVEGTSVISTNFTAATVAALFGTGTLPGRYSVMFADLGTYVHAP
jgi:hypothetical protein